ncbi:hypothetical protein LP420_16200 [Massilia sp. B-10]|nr:hypothetical protein LP420_16200 [Massilia sp. B-10]
MSKSALEAKAMGYLKEDDVIVFNPYELLHVAKVEARAMFDIWLPSANAPSCDGRGPLRLRHDQGAAGQHARRRLHFGARLQAGRDDRRDRLGR